MKTESIVENTVLHLDSTLAIFQLRRIIRWGKSMPRLILAAITLFLLVGIPERSLCVNEDPDSLSLQQAQVYLDSLWAIYEVRDTDEKYARQRMHAFLHDWADSDSQHIATNSDDPMLQSGNAVFDASLRPRFPHLAKYYKPRDSRQRSSQGEYVVLPDSITVAVVDDAEVWDTLSNYKIRAFSERSRICYDLSYRKFKPRPRTDRTVLYDGRMRWMALNSFMHGARVPLDTAPSIEVRGHVDLNWRWIDSFFPTCPYSFVTQPSVYSIVFNHTLTEAVVCVEEACGYQGSTELYTLSKSGWKWKYTVSGWVQ